MKKIVLLSSLCTSLVACSSSGTLGIPELEIDENGVTLDTGTGAVLGAGRDGVFVNDESAGTSVGVGIEETSILFELNDQMIEIPVASNAGILQNGDDDDDELELIEISGDGQVVVVNADTPANLTISGTNHTINIQSPIINLVIAGSNSLLRFGDGVTVESCIVAGNDLVAERGVGVSLSCDVAGVGNIGFE